MFCPHCHNQIPDGSNICPLCYGSLAGMKTQSAPRAAGGDAAQQPRAPKKTAKPAAANDDANVALAIAVAMG